MLLFFSNYKGTVTSQRLFFSIKVKVEATCPSYRKYIFYGEALYLSKRVCGNDGNFSFTSSDGEPKMIGVVRWVACYKNFILVLHHAPSWRHCLGPREWLNLSILSPRLFLFPTRGPFHCILSLNGASYITSCILVLNAQWFTLMMDFRS